ncbi:Beta-fructofuranosidase protein [Dioscorea alata]|nr:Beta-fructofuranosidase protein [Dioscorea alata]
MLRATDQLESSPAKLGPTNPRQHRPPRASTTSTSPSIRTPPPTPINGHLLLHLSPPPPPMADYIPLASSSSSPPPLRPLKLLSFALATALLTLVVFFNVHHRSDPSPNPILHPSSPLSRGPSHGVSEKTSGISSLFHSNPFFPWTNHMLQWQRTAFHFQPEKNWMNDPNGPVFYKGWYHLFYQYNPDSAVWGNITWGHAVSRDLIRWRHLPLAMVRDQWYDSDGVWTGSATILPDGTLIMLYTGSTNASVQVQNLAIPTDPTDPLLLEWTKSDANPVLVPPPGVGPKDFRDPTTAWYDDEAEAWRFVIGTKEDKGHSGIALVYQTKDFLNYELLPGRLHGVARTGMWECVDFYPVATTAGVGGLDTSVVGEKVKHVLKASMDDDRHDYYAIGTYESEKVRWVPDDPEEDVGLGLRYDWGKFYASKTFFDQQRARRVLWGWVGETDSEFADVQKGWASLQGIPRTVLLDLKTGSNLLQWPVKEVESLRASSQEFSNINMSSGSVVPLDVRSATQLDIEAEFVIDAASLAETLEADVGYNCSTSGGATHRGALGPFGLLVLADPKLSEQTAVYFYIAKRPDGGLQTHFCHDEMKSSHANDIYKRVVGNKVPVLDGETLSVRILVDHSIVESFAQGGRTCITSRVYPTEAIYNSARIFVFNNATGARVAAKSIKVWQMNAAEFDESAF